MFPAETTASAVPSAIARHAATSELSGFDAHRLGRLLVHRDHLLGDDVLEPAGVQRRPGRRRPATIPSRGGLERAGDDLVRAAVAAHRVDGHPDGHGV